MIKRLAVAVILLGIFPYALAADSEKDDDIDKLILDQARKFRVLLQTIHEHYVDSVDIEKLSEDAFNRMLNDLDPASAYFPADDKNELEEEQEGQKTGIGAKLVSLNDTIHVIDIYPGSPADSAKLKRGDKILFIDGKNMAGMPPANAYVLISGEEGTEVSLMTKRGYGNAQEEYKIM